MDAQKRRIGDRLPASGLAMLLLQLAASRAEIGDFASREREAPQVAAARYRAAMEGSAHGAGPAAGRLGL